VGVALMPLLRKQIVVDEVTLNELELSLMVDARGRNNWDDLAQADDKEPTGGSDTEMFSSQQIAGLNIRDARIEYRDENAAAHYRLSNFSLQTGGLGQGEPVPLELETRIEDVAAGTAALMGLSATAAIDLAAETYLLDDFDLKLQLDHAESGKAGPEIRIQSPGLNADLAAQTLSLESFRAELADLNAEGTLSAQKILDDPILSGTLQVAAFSPNSLMQTLNMEASATADPEVLQHARFNTSFNGGTTQMSLSNFELDLDQSHFTGEVNISDFDRPAIGFDLAVDEFDADRYLEPESPESGQEAVAIPREELQGPSVQGTLTIGKLMLAGLAFDQAELGISLDNSKLRLHPLTAGFYGGRYSGDIRLDSSGQLPLLSLDEEIDSITFQNLVSDLVDTESLSGTALGHIRMSGRGASSDELMRSLNGDLGLTLTEGALEGINIWHEIRKGMAIYKGLEAPPPEPNRTVFSRFEVDGVVNDGIVSTREMNLELPNFPVTP
jgi:AsmA protein